MEIEGVKCQYRNYARAKIARKLCRAGAVSTKLNVFSHDKTIGLYLQGAKRLSPFNSIKTLTPFISSIQEILSLVRLQPVGSPAIVGTQGHLHGVGALHGLDDDLLHPLALVGVDAEVEFIVHL